MFFLIRNLRNCDPGNNVMVGRAGRATSVIYQKTVVEQGIGFPRPR